MLRLRSLTTVLAFGCILRFVGCGGSSSGGAPLDGGSRTGAACTSDATCARPTPYCDPVNQVCVECVASPNCGRGLSCAPTHACVECLDNSQCGAPTPYCSPGFNCVPCLTDGNCPNGQACDQTRFRCIPTCTSDAQCAAPVAHCDTATSRCVMCLADADCPMQRPHCNPTSHACDQCVTDADCANGGRCTNGFCGFGIRDAGGRGG